MRQLRRFGRLLVGLIAVLSATVATASVSVTQTSTSNQPAAFRLSVYTGCGSAELKAVYVYDGIVAAPQRQWGSLNVPPGYVAMIPVSWDSEICDYTLHWTEARGLLANSTYTFMDHYLEGGWSSCYATAATANVNGPQGQIVAYATNGGSGPASLAIRVDNASYGNGITQITVTDPERGTTSVITPLPNPQLAANTYTWIDTMVPAISASRTLAITARGTVGSYNYQLGVAAIPVTSSVVKLTPLVPATTNQPIQPSFNIAVADMGGRASYNGQLSPPGYIEYISITGAANSSFGVNAFTWNQNWSHPSGVLPAGVYSYHVQVRLLEYFWNDASEEWDNRSVTLPAQTITFTINNKTAQTIAFPEPSGTYAAGSVFNPGATSSSGLPIEYTIVAGRAEMVPPPPVGNGTGLTGTYFYNGYQAGIRTDPQINFNWYSNAPAGISFHSPFSVT